jgi:ABC-type multidrug transport system ATPase subunit
LIFALLTQLRSDGESAENISFSAFSRLPSTYSLQEKRSFVENVLIALGLSDIRFQIIGDERQRGISGGQRKRVNVGIELVSDPLVLFLDEPTSGLDATSSMELIRALRQIAELGLTVVAVRDLLFFLGDYLVKSDLFLSGLLLETDIFQSSIVD